MAKSKLKQKLAEVALITSCAASKSVQAVASGYSDLPEKIENLDAGAKAWSDILMKHEPTHTPSQLYRGMTFITIAKIAAELIPPENIYIMSGAYGVTHFLEKMVPYDFTSDPHHPESVLPKFQNGGEPFIQTVWWRLLNQYLHGTPNPLAAILNDPKYKLVVLACNARSYKFIADDVLSTPAENLSKLRIITTGRSGPGIAAQLKRFSVYIPRGDLKDTIGNRNDPNHRAALKFLRYISDNPENIDKAPHDQYPAPTTSNLSPLSAARGVAEIAEMLKSVPALLELDPEQAYRQFRTMFGPTTRSTFRVALRSLTESEIKEPSEVSNAAIEALMSISGGLNRQAAGGASYDDETVALQAVKTFIASLKQVDPGATFTAVEVVNWSVAYYRDQNKIPVLLKSSQRLSNLLRTYVQQLGLVAAYKSAGGGGQAYRIKMDS